MSVSPIKAYVQPHGLTGWPFLPADSDGENYDRLRDDAHTPTVWDCDEPEPRLNLSKCRGACLPAPATRPAVLSPAGRPDHDAPGGEPTLPPLGAVAHSDSTSTR